MTNMRPEEVKGEDLADLEIATNKIWEELSDLKDATFLLDLGRDCSIFYSPAIASELGGYVHIRSEMGKLVHSYHLKDKTISLSCTPSLLLPTSHFSLWECSYPSSLTHKKDTSLNCDGLPPLCANYPWLVSQFVKDDGTGGQIFYAMHDPQFQYRCHIPQLFGKRIRGFFHGWVILSNNLMWSLWNPSTSKVIRLPPMNIFKDEDSDNIIGQCCLSAPPDKSSSVLLLTRTNKPTFVFCRLDRSRKKLRWTEMSYAKQLKKISIDGGLVHSLTCCNGRVYALSTDGSFGSFVINIDITVSDKEVMIKLLLFGSCPAIFLKGSFWSHFLKGYATELFCIMVGFKEETRTTIDAVIVFKLDLSNMWLEDDLQDEDLAVLQRSRMWEKMLDLKNAVFCVDLGRDCSILYNPAIASKVGGCIHIRGETGEIIHSYHLKDKTLISPASCMPNSLVLPTSHVSWWECSRLEDDHNADYKQEERKDDKIAIRSFTDNEVDQVSESVVMPDIPFDDVEIIMKFCIGVEYMNFRATCKRLHCHTSLINWRDKRKLLRLQNYSLVSPWLMVVDKELGIITFTDPLSGDKYFIKKDLQIQRIHGICCSGFGWVLFYTANNKLVLYNPFTSDVRELPPDIKYSDGSSFCFSAPPTSPRSCTVFRFTRRDCYVHTVGGPPWTSTWSKRYDLTAKYCFPNALHLPTSYGKDHYALSSNRELLHVIENVLNKYKDVYSWTLDVPKAPKAGSKAVYNKNFLTKWDRGILLVMVSDDDESIEVFKLDDDTKEWRKIDGIGRYMIYICDTTCLCVEAKIREMENKIYLPQLHTQNGRIVSYSLETGSYNTFSNARYNVEETFCRIRQLDSPHTWIQPSWS